VAQRIFLSYRRSDAAQRATFLKVVLQQKLHDVSVFVDRQSINPSERWPDRLTATRESSSAVVALIGPNWRFGPDGADRFQARRTGCSGSWSTGSHALARRRAPPGGRSGKPVT
jgi:TIR domain